MTLAQELRGWIETEGMSDDSRRKLWLMRKAADRLEYLEELRIKLENELMRLHRRA